MAQLMSLPLTVYCFSKIQIGFTFLVPAHLGSPVQRAVKRLSVDTKLETFFPCSLYLGVWCGNEETIPNTDYIFKPPRSKHATGINKKTRKHLFSKSNVHRTSGLPFREKTSSGSVTCFPIWTADAGCRAHRGYAPSPARCAAFPPA